MKIFWIFVFIFLSVLFILNIYKKQNIVYLPFNIPGKQMAATIPPIGTFIEDKYKTENIKSSCSIYQHELVHWNQYVKMGFFSFYYNYLKLYVISGRINNWMEEEARRPCSEKSKR